MVDSKYDVVIVGGGLSGLCAAYTLSNYGIKSCLVEKSAQLGGGNQSFRDDDGNLFDMGYHALDDMRSPLTSRLFSHVLEHEIHRIPLRRGIVLDKQVLAYNSALEDWPEGLAKKVTMATGDDLGADLSFDGIARVYGREFSNYCKNNIMASYPSEIGAQEMGREPQQSLGLIYPWFFPKSEAFKPRSDNEWNAYHDKMRQQEQRILYPKRGGFNAFIDALAAGIDRNYCDIFLDCGEVKFDFEKQTQCRGVQIDGLSLSADHYFWCAPFFPLANMFGMTLPKGKGQTLALGSFAFDKEVCDQYHELLVGSLDYPVNRISFPGKIRQEKNNLIQVEFLYPSNKTYAEREIAADWLTCLDELGLSGGQKPRSQRVDFMPRGMVTEESLDSITSRFRTAFSNLETNVFVPFVNAGPENINRLVPSVINNTTDYLVNHWRV
jgi:protoporphyrinogen oxidase